MTDTCYYVFQADPARLQCVAEASDARTDNTSLSANFIRFDTFLSDLGSQMPQMEISQMVLHRDISLTGLKGAEWHHMLLHL